MTHTRITRGNAVALLRVAQEGPAKGEAPESFVERLSFLSEHLESPEVVKTTPSGLPVIGEARTDGARIDTAIEEHVAAMERDILEGRADADRIRRAIRLVAVLAGIIASASQLLGGPAALVVGLPLLKMLAEKAIELIPEESPTS